MPPLDVLHWWQESPTVHQAKGDALHKTSYPIDASYIIYSSFPILEIGPLKFKVEVQVQSLIFTAIQTFLWHLS